MIALLMSAALMGGQTLPASQVQHDWAAVIEPMEYQLVGITDDTYTLVMHGRAVNQLWVRYEERPGRFDDHASSRYLTEIDCDGWRLRSVYATQFAERNLGGEAVSTGPITRSWAPAAPGTVGEAILEFGCGG